MTDEQFDEIVEGLNKEIEVLCVRITELVIAKLEIKLRTMGLVKDEEVD